jgi:hypothetical protein
MIGNLTESELLAIRIASECVPSGTLGDWPILTGAFSKLAWPLPPGTPGAYVAVFALIARQLCDVVPEVVRAIAMGEAHWAGCTGTCCRCRVQAAEQALQALAPHRMS